MRDANGNQFAGAGPLKDGNNRPITPVGLSPQELGTVEALRVLKAEYAVLQKKFSDLAADNAALKAEHDETLKDIGVMSDANTELQSKYVALTELHVLAMDKIAGMDAEAQAAQEHLLSEAEEVAKEREAAACKAEEIVQPQTEEPNAISIESTTALPGVEGVTTEPGAEEGIRSGDGLQETA